MQVGYFVDHFFFCDVAVKMVYGYKNQGINIFHRFLGDGYQCYDLSHIKFKL